MLTTKRLDIIIDIALDNAFKHYRGRHPGTMPNAPSPSWNPAINVIILLRLLGLKVILN